MYLRALLLACLSLLGTATCVQAQDSASYSFLAFGHIYGAHEDTAATQPAATLLDAVPVIRELDPDHIMILGDVVRDLRLPVRWQNYERFMARLPGQHYLAPGNHDPDPCPAQPVTYLNIQGDPHIILCTECLVQHQASRLIAAVQALADAVARTHGNLLFVHSHRMPWILAEDSLADLDEYINAPLRPDVDLDTVRALQAAILALAGQRQLHWFAGDIGASWSRRILCVERENRHYYAAGLGDYTDDAIWQVQVLAGESVVATPTWLNPFGQNGPPRCSHADWKAWWAQEQGEPMCDCKLSLLHRHWKKLLAIALLSVAGAAGLWSWFRWRRRRLGK